MTNTAICEDVMMLSLSHATAIGVFLPDCGVDDDTSPFYLCSGNHILYTVLAALNSVLAIRLHYTKQTVPQKS